MKYIVWCLEYAGNGYNTWMAYEFDTLDSALAYYNQVKPEAIQERLTITLKETK